jgi:hypothetical protein
VEKHEAGEVETMSLPELRALRDRLLREYPALARPRLVE